MTFFYRGKSYSVFILLLFACSFRVAAQTHMAQASNVNEVILSTSDRTYISFGQGLGNYKTPYGVKRLNPLIFEGQISPDFFLKLSKKKTIGLAFFPKIVVRMYNENSLPVKTPSYMPSLLFYHSIKSPFPRRIFRYVFAEDQLAFMTYRLIHHSNGQDGEYYLPGSDSINFKNGNFSTNAIEIGFSWCSIDSGNVGKTFMNGRIAYERQLNFEREYDLRNTYYYDKLSIEGRFIYSEKMKAYVTYSFMWGTRHFGTRHSLDIYAAFKPFPKLTDFSVFARGYIGPDYYNLYFANTLRAVTVGIIADPLSIPIFKKERRKRQQ